MVISIMILKTFIWLVPIFYSGILFSGLAPFARHLSHVPDPTYFSNRQYLP